MLLNASYASIPLGQRALPAPSVFPQHQVQTLVLETSNSGSLALSLGYLLQGFTFLIVRSFSLMYNLNLPCCNSSLFLTDVLVKEQECILYLFATAFYIFESCIITSSPTSLPNIYIQSPIPSTFSYYGFVFLNRLLRPLVFC